MIDVRIIAKDKGKEKERSKILHQVLPWNKLLLIVTINIIVIVSSLLHFDRS